MRQHDALWRPGRAGRVEDVREIEVDHGDVGPTRVGQGHGGRADELRGARTIARQLGVEDDDRPELGAFPLERLPGRGLLGGAEQHPDSGVAQDVGLPSRRCFRVEWDVCGSCLEDTVDRANSLKGLLEAEPDPVAAAYAERSEEVRYLVRQLVELAVGETAVPVHDGGRVRL